MNEPKHRGYSYGVRHLTAEASISLLEFVETQLAAEATRPELTVVELIELGSVYVNDERSLSVARFLTRGDRVRIHTRPRRYSRPTDLDSRLISESHDIVIVDKPAGLPVHALVDNIKDNLISFLEEWRGGRLYITHRLDVETSGLVLLAKTPEAQARLNQGFANGTIKRTYAAYVDKSVSLGEHVHFMEPSPTAPKTVALEPHDGWQRCALVVIACEERAAKTSVINEGRTTWQLAVPIEKVYRLEIQLLTGRPQQIRAQLAALGSPIIGDEKYGSWHSAVDAFSGKAAVTLQAIAIHELGQDIG